MSDANGKTNGYDSMNPDDVATQEGVHDIIILGSGPAGLTAAIYAARANMKPLLIEGHMSGGQLMITTDVENYPGFPKGITGPAMIDEFKAQAERFGTEFVYDEAEHIDVTQRPFVIKTAAEETYKAHSIIVATGASARWLGLDSEDEYKNYGVSACATCDGAFFKDFKVGVVGGGDTAMEEALFLTRYAEKVYVIHRRDEFRASKIMQNRVLAHDKIEVVWNSVVTEVLGESDGPRKKVTGVRLKDTVTDEESTLDLGGLFIAIGHTPNTAMFKGILDMDETGYLTPKKGSTYTNVPGIFACGDAADHVYRQAVTAAGTGCMAAIDAERWLEEVRSGEKIEGVALDA